jgi:hypothetical protein
MLTNHVNHPAGEVKELTSHVYKVTSPSEVSEGLVKHLIVIPKW